MIQPSKFIPEPKKSDLLRRSYLARIVRTLNAWQDCRVFRGTKDYVHYGDSSNAIEINQAAIPQSASTGNLSVMKFTITSLSDGALNGSTELGPMTAAFPFYFRTPPFVGAILVPGLSVGMSVLCMNVGASVTGIPGVDWMWQNFEGMAWGAVFRFKDSANSCAPMKCNVAMTNPVSDV